MRKGCSILFPRINSETEMIWEIFCHLYYFLSDISFLWLSQAWNRDEKCFVKRWLKKKIRSRGCLRHTPCFQWNEMLGVLGEHHANAWLEVGGKSSNRRDNSLPVIWQELPAGRGVFIAADGSYGRQCKMLSSFYFSQFGFFDLGGNVPWPLERADKDRKPEMTNHQASSEDIKNQIIKC